jgi:uncharacterized protein with beta-barrel porin domain
MRPNPTATERPLYYDAAYYDAAYYDAAQLLLWVRSSTAIQSQTFHTQGYTETDLTSGGFALGFNSRNATDTRSELGERFDRPLLLNPEAALILRAEPESRFYETDPACPARPEERVVQS